MIARGRRTLARHVAALGVDWVRLAGRLQRDEVVELDRRAWLVASASHAEGRGLSLTGAAACGTPAVATDIDRRRTSVVDRVTGLVVPVEQIGDAIADPVADPARRAQSCGGRTRSSDHAHLGRHRARHHPGTAVPGSERPGGPTAAECVR